MRKRSKRQKAIEDLLDIIWLCDCIINDPDTEEDYNTAMEQMEQTVKELEELEVRHER